MKRKTPLRAKSPLKTKTPLRPVSKKRLAEIAENAAAGIKPTAIPTRKPRKVRIPKGQGRPRNVLADGTRVPRDATLDQLMSLYIRRHGKCELSGREIPCGGSLQHHHVIPRGRSKALRWHPLNGLCLCEAHHSWVHGHIILAARLLDDVFGSDRWNEVERIQKEEPVPKGHAKAHILAWLKEEMKAI